LGIYSFQNIPLICSFFFAKYQWAEAARGGHKKLKPQKQDNMGTLSFAKVHQQHIHINIYVGLVHGNSLFP